MLLVLNPESSSKIFDPCTCLCVRGLPPSVIFNGRKGFHSSFYRHPRGWTFLPLRISTPTLIPDPRRGAKFAEQTSKFVPS